jgi:hypothetical protein
VYKSGEKMEPEAIIIYPSPACPWRVDIYHSLYKRLKDVVINNDYFPMIGVVLAITEVFL